MANILFGNEYPVGKSISVFNNNQTGSSTLQWEGVFEDCPDN